MAELILDVICDVIIDFRILASRPFRRRTKPLEEAVTGQTTD